MDIRFIAKLAIEYWRNTPSAGRTDVRLAELVRFYAASYIGPAEGWTDRQACDVNRAVAIALGAVSGRLIIRTASPSGTPTGSVSCFSPAAVLDSVARVHPADSVRISIG